MTQPNRRAWRAAMALLAAGALATGAAPAAWAQDWPTQPIKLIVPYAAGGPTDAIARLLATKMGDTLGKPVVVDNRAGAGGMIGVDATVKAAPDGYTLALTAPGPLAGMPNLTKAPYAPDDVQYLTLVARIPSVIVVNSKSGLHTLDDLVKKAKADPGRLTYSSAGPGTTPHIGMELFKEQAGVNLLHVPYKGAAPAVLALLSGEVDVTMVDLLPALPHVSSGAFTVLAVAGPQRAPQLPQAPTTREQGLPGVSMETTYGLITPKGLPANVAARIREAATAAVNAPDMKQALLKQGAIPASSTSEDYRQLMADESRKWKAIITQAKISLE